MQFEKGDSLTINARNGTVRIVVDDKGDIWVLTKDDIIRKGLRSCFVSIDGQEECLSNVSLMKK